MTDDAGGLESLVTAIPGRRSIALTRELSRTEPRGVTYLAHDFPVAWARAHGALVWDVDGNRYLDATAAFGVAVTGHANGAVAAAIAAQASLLPHAMGDVHPAEVKIALLRALAAIAPVDDARAYLGANGSDAIEFARKTALLATGKPNLVAFEGSYHGLSYGALAVGGIARFRDPWAAQIPGGATLVPYPRDAAGLATTLAAIEDAFARDASLGGIIVEPIAGRAGVVIPPDGFLPGLRTICDARGALLIVDEIYTAFGRTGDTFVCNRALVRPDVLCVGKALGGGFPISAAIVAGRVANAWSPSAGEALHTATFLGNPMGCAAALAQLDELTRLDVAGRARALEPVVRTRLNAIGERSPDVTAIRGRGILWAVECASPAVAGSCVTRALARGLLLLQNGLAGEAVAFAPPPIVTGAQLHRMLDLLEASLHVEGDV